ncbi:SRPBCC family protein [Nocardia sp. NBC_00565]|uniref:SRPBCC family protein n=1 Tax=Nocardia sp. NBC_00565 TaxID=2975993 RepID=UPI002E801522|nr:SRPBCC family protein [Nocardia sp. NBC_00565]WUC04807.1 SRPBCC family protein [Nocardia sp. NBC_00565]
MTDRFVISAHRNLRVSPEEVWNLTSDTSRYADWVSSVLEVTEHHEQARKGDTYTERVKSIGPLTTRAEWTVQTIEPMSLRIDSGKGFAPLTNVINVFRFAPIDDGNGTSMTYEFHFDLRPRQLGALVHKLLAKSMPAEFDASMRMLELVILSERSDDTN